MPILQNLIDKTPSPFSMIELMIEAEQIFSSKYGGRAYKSIECCKRVYYYWYHGTLRKTRKRPQ
jgi:hypothetical protein